MSWRPDMADFGTRGRVLKLTILSVAYPFAPVGPDAVGGAEQVQAQVERATVKAGHRSIVIAMEGSQVAGELIAIPRQQGALDESARLAGRAARARRHRKGASIGRCRHSSFSWNRLRRILAATWAACPRNPSSTSGVVSARNLDECPAANSYPLRVAVAGRSLPGSGGFGR